MPREPLFYTIDPASGDIVIDPEDYDHLRWQFRQVGIDIESIRTEADFREAYTRSRGFVDAALLRSVSRVDNRFVRAAFEALLIDGDHEVFKDLAQRAERLTRLKNSSQR